MSIDAEVSGDLDRLIRALSGVDGPAVQREARRAARTAMKPAVGEVQRAALALPGRAPAGTLRRDIAAAVGMSTTATGVRIQVRGARLGNRRNLPRILDSGRPWRHPVHGNRQVWVTQATGRPWFRSTLDRRRDNVRKGVLDAVDDAVRRELGVPRG